MNPRCLPCGKISYDSLEVAEQHAQQIFNRDRTVMGAYFKPKCGSWHLTSTQLLRASKNREMYSKPKIVARDFQDAAVDHTFDYFGTNVGNPIVALPTGTGKSIVLSFFIKKALNLFPKTRVLALTHVKELIEQNMKTLLKVWPTAPAGVYSAGLKRRDHTAPITFAGIQSIHRKAELFGWIDLVLIDECHLVSPKGTTMYREFIRQLREINPKLKVIGYTATAFRLGQGMLTDPDGLFTDVCFDMTSREAFNWLIAQGWISPIIPKRTQSELDVTGVRLQHGEYNLADLQEKVDRDTVTIAALREAVNLAGNRKHWLVFASGIQHAEHISNFLEGHFGITAGAVHSKLPDATRDGLIRDFKSGKIQALVNNNILTTGFDFPEIDCIVMLRPTASPVLWVQMLGRGTRPVYANGYPIDTVDQRLQAIAEGPKKNCLVLDFAGNTKRLGPINDPVLPRRKKGLPGIAPVRLCEVCGCYSHASARFCENPDCGVEFPRAVKIQVQASTQELIAGIVPKFVKFDVDRVIYKLHRKEGKPDSMQVSYHCGLRTFREFICLDHGGYAGRLARQWWEARLPRGWRVPPSVHDGMEGISFLRVPTRITIMIKGTGKYDEIMGYEFNGDPK